MVAHGAFVIVTVEDFAPDSALRETDLVIEQTVFAQRTDDDHVLTYTGNPPMEGNDTSAVVDMKDVQSRRTESAIVSPHPDQCLHELKKILHYGISFEPVPPHECVCRVFRVITPILILEDFLAHEQHRYARRRQQHRRRKTRTASSVPGSGIAGICQESDP